MGNFDKAVDYYSTALDYLTDPMDRKNVYLAIGSCSFNMAILHLPTWTIKLTTHYITEE